MRFRVLLVGAVAEGVEWYRATLERFVGPLIEAFTRSFQFAVALLFFLPVLPFMLLAAGVDRLMNSDERNALFRRSTAYQNMQWRMRG